MSFSIVKPLQNYEGTKHNMHNQWDFFNNNKTYECIYTLRI